MELGNHLCVEGTRAGGQEAIRAIKGTLNVCRAVGRGGRRAPITNCKTEWLTAARERHRLVILRFFYLSLKRSKVKRSIKINFNLRRE